MLSSELIISTATMTCLPASKAPNARYHLLHMPPNGGRPMMLRLPIRKAKVVIGMTRPIPRIWLISVLWAATRMAPAQKNSVILPKACMAMCMPPPTTLISVASIAPSTM